MHRKSAKFWRETVRLSTVGTFPGKGSHGIVSRIARARGEKARARAVPKSFRSEAGFAGSSRVSLFPLAFLFPLFFVFLGTRFVGTPTVSIFIITGLGQLGIATASMQHTLAQLSPFDSHVIDPFLRAPDYVVLLVRFCWDFHVH